MSDESRPPRGLSSSSRRIWRDLMRSFEDWDASDLAILETTLAALDRWRAARRRVDNEGLTIIDKLGRERPHPCIGTESAARVAVVAGFRALNLGAEGKAALSASEAGRRGAMARWHKGVA